MSDGLAKLLLREPCTEKIELRRDQRMSSSMEPRPESLGEGIPGEEREDGKCGFLESSSFTFSRAIVEAATRETERVETAWQISWKRVASWVVKKPRLSG